METFNDEFKVTEGWLSRQIVRHDIKFKRASGKKASANSNGTDEQKLTQFLQLRSKFSPENMYKTDEIGLYYRATSMVLFVLNTNG